MPRFGFKRNRVAVAILPVVLLVSSWCFGDWPSRVFAPYFYVGAGDHFQMMDANRGAGVKYFTLAFVIAREDRVGKKTSYRKEPSWDGTTGMEAFADQIAAVRKAGGDVICSFGGEGGKEIGLVEEDEAKLEADYQGIIDRYHFTWLDFDVEGKSLDMKLVGNRRRNAVLARLQKKNPGLRVSFTLPVDPEGISGDSLELLKDAVKQGVKVQSVDLMVMYFGKKYIHHGKSEGELGIESARAAWEQVRGIEGGIGIGLCPCIGENGSKEEVFGVDDAKELEGFAEGAEWVREMHFWSVNDDGKAGWKYSRVFEEIEKKGRN